MRKPESPGSTPGTAVLGVATVGVPDQGCWSAPAWLSAPFSVELEPEERLTLKDTSGHINHVKAVHGSSLPGWGLAGHGVFSRGAGRGTGPRELGPERDPVPGRWGRSRAPGAGGGAGPRALGAEPGPGRWGRSRAPGRWGPFGFGPTKSSPDTHAHGWACWSLRPSVGHSVHLPLLPRLAYLLSGGKLFVPAAISRSNHPFSSLGDDPGPSLGSPPAPLGRCPQSPCADRSCRAATC
ncbi:uncharacterized protein LOC125962643 [Orcinus orca]|uniref:uncharacterized protein LOC125962643 n=1 Tax=Orcinus orca TaxID=9733 RepID=UPI0021114E96|nr:uncharacterized protein LOC125962643 [Orcinus orca]